MAAACCRLAEQKYCLLHLGVVGSIFSRLEAYGEYRRNPPQSLDKIR